MTGAVGWSVGFWPTPAPVTGAAPVGPASRGTPRSSGSTEKRAPGDRVDIAVQRLLANGGAVAAWQAHDGRVGGHRQRGGADAAREEDEEDEEPLHAPRMLHRVSVRTGIGGRDQVLDHAARTFAAGAPSARGTRSCRSSSR